MFSARMLNNVLFIALLTVTFLSLKAQSYFPETGPEALYQRALDVRSRMNVLCISLQPGYEDFSALAYFRLARGAKIMTAYLTNGEAGESDIRGEYPFKLAAIQREEATQAMDYLGGEAFFLNFPDIVAAADTVAIHSIWLSDSLQLKLMALISNFRPDVVILSRDWEWGGKSLRWKILKDNVLQAVKRLEPSKSAKQLGEVMGLTRWGVEKVWAATEGGEGKEIMGTSLPIENLHPIWKKSYAAIGEEAAQRYATLASQRRLWRKQFPAAKSGEPMISYDLAYPSAKVRPKAFTQTSTRPLTPSLQWTEQAIQNLTQPIVKSYGAAPSAAKTKSLLAPLLSIMDTLDVNIAKSKMIESTERKILLQWKLTLENLRTNLLGVKVIYALSNTILTQRQLTVFRVDSVIGLPAGGQTEIYFPFVDQGWVINEALERHMPVELHKELRLLSPAKLEYNFPQDQYGLSQSSVGSTLMFFIIHKGAKREESFVHRTSFKMFYTPRFVTEILSPIVRAIPSERLPVRLTNQSRDGVRDRVYASDSLVSSSVGNFRLNGKGLSSLDTLILTWKRPLENGTYPVPLYIGQEVVGQFAARKFEAKIDSTKRVALITGIENSPTEEALRRLGVQWKKIRGEQNIESEISSSNVLIVDRRALTIHPQISNNKKALERFVAAGGHLIVMPQDAAAWNETPLIESLSMQPSSDFDENISLSVDSTHTLLSSPNIITKEDWSNWLYRKGHNRIAGTALESSAIPVQTTGSHHPLLISWRRGAGKVTYVDLALQPQLLNIHPGAFRLLANILSY